MNLLKQKQGQLYHHTFMNLARLRKYSLMFFLIALEISTVNNDSSSLIRDVEKEFQVHGEH